MDVLPDFVDMAITPQERAEDYNNGPDIDSAKPIYPYNLAISFTQDELDKLNLDCDCEPGDQIILNCIAKVTTVSKYDTTEGSRCSVNMQITHIEAEGDDDEDDTQAAPRGKLGPDRLYNK